MGLGMLWLPVVAPRLVAAHTAFGASTREPWLLFMGTLNASLGAGVLGWHAMKQAWRIPAWLEPVPQPEPLPMARPQPARAAA
jgi:hypothetical protein